MKMKISVDDTAPHPRPNGVAPVSDDVKSIAETQVVITDSVKKQYDVLQTPNVVETEHVSLLGSYSVVKTDLIDDHSDTNTYLKCERDAVSDNKTSKHVNVRTGSDVVEEEEGVGSVETTALRRCSETSGSVADHSAISSTDGCLTMTGTIKRGKKAGQSVDVKLNISREELEDLEATINAKRSSVSRGCCTCSPVAGAHIVLWTVLCLPFAVVISGVYSFYVGTITWYNAFTYYTEEKPLVFRVFVSPVLILLYPFLILIFSISLGLYAGVIQISWFFDSWHKEVTDLEKGFYGWFCAALKHEDCSPYEVVILTDIQPSIGDGDEALMSN